MPLAPSPGSERMPRASRVAVTAAYATQGLGYAVVVTSLPTLKNRQQIDDTVVNLIILGVCVAAAGGSVLAGALATRLGARVALSTGFVLQAIALPAAALPVPFPVFVAAFVVYGVGLGCVDAASAMQGVVVQRAYGRSLLGGFFAAYTAAAIVGALLVSAFSLTPTTAGVALVVAAAIALLVALAGLRFFAREAAPETAVAAERTALPHRAIWALGFIILAAFTVDSAVSTWSSILLTDNLGTTLAVAPLGYALYQVVILVTRLVTDRLLGTLPRATVAAAALIVSVIGCLVVSLIPAGGAAIAGFALAGVAVGALVPITFGATGELDPARSDEIIARVNLFNYAGAIAGAVLVGFLGDVFGLALGFLLPAVALAAVLPVLRRLRRPAASVTAADAG
ncbi:MAG: MFS transporter [Microbacterium sp. 71-23]|uniref:MFS transporter n=1 Tax=Microbacterium TaxID=33882 RepID=UPI00092B4987|nr:MULTISPECIES: MFS transporter [unclassified Microbacterium]OJU75617.1 MAG: MFS transporter [Microbacterium sp. 71-23]